MFFNFQSDSPSESMNFDFGNSPQEETSSDVSEDSWNSVSWCNIVAFQLTRFKALVQDSKEDCLNFILATKAM